MRKGVHVDVNNNVYHMMCKSENITKGIITVETETCETYMELIINCPHAFFCHSCDKYLFDTVEFMSAKLFAIPPVSIYPKCSILINNAIIHNNENNYYDIYINKLLVVPQIHAE